MYMKRVLLAFFLLCSTVSTMRADEGMWLISKIKELNMGHMNELGLKLSAQDIYSINKACLKDAIVIFGRGCTGEVISKEGLILTNHHCGYDIIQQHSSVEHDYLKDGFWAKNKQAEIPSPGLSVTFLHSVEDVTDQVLSQVTKDMDEKTRSASIREAISAIQKKINKKDKFQVEVKPFFSGNQFILFRSQVFNDVRLVGAPPSAIGKFGADTDNWMWPRHTGDFALFRVYANKKGQAAEYSADNVPYQPKHHLPISLAGTPKDAFAMTIGYPGSTNRYLSSWGIEERMNIINESRIGNREIKQNIWMEDMQADPKVRIQYASKYARSSNYWKNSIGMNKGLKKLKVLERKQKLEQDIEAWIAQDPERRKEYGSMLAMLEKTYTQRREPFHALLNIQETLLNGTEIFSLGRNVAQLREQVTSQADYIQEVEKLYKDYNPDTDQKVLAALMEKYAQTVDAKYLPNIYKLVDSDFNKDYKAFADYIFSNSVFASLEQAKGIEKKQDLSKDPVLVTSQDLAAIFHKIRAEFGQYSSKVDQGNRLFEKALSEMQKKGDLPLYPDANFTMRLSYGTVGDYSPKDGVMYSHFTTTTGILEKEDPDNWEFVVPEKLKELIENEDYGDYMDADGSMHVCFTTNNDITGGNSGSPVINAKGELFGLAFDGNWEAMSGDIAFETELQKCINVDIRYVLFIIDKFAGASHLVDEMTLVK